MIPVSVYSSTSLNRHKPSTLLNHSVLQESHQLKKTQIAGCHPRTGGENSVSRDQDTQWSGMNGTTPDGLQRGEQYQRSDSYLTLSSSIFQSELI